MYCGVPGVRLATGRRTEMRTRAVPPAWRLKKPIWVALGRPRRSVNATTRPVPGAANMLREVPALTWKPVVRVTARQGLLGHEGADRSTPPPSSSTRAEAGE